MLIRLKFKVQFASTGKLFEGTHEFQTGMTAITGRNEAGKSLRLEMIRYALFGAKALRSDSKSYKRLEVKLIFALGGKQYEVHRINSKHRLMDAETTEEIATGVKPVNDAIIKLFGYDLEVFDVANAVNQDEIASLSRKTPSERKRMVDRTIGLDAVDRVLKQVNDEIVTVRKATDMVKTMITPLVEPICPAGLENTSSVELNVELTRLRATAQERQFIIGQIEGAKCEAPEPINPDADTYIPQTVDELVAQQEAILGTRATIDKLIRDKKTFDLATMAIKGAPDAAILTKYIENDYDQKWKDFEAYEKKRVVKPKLGRDQLKILETGLEIERENARATKFDCYNCGHENIMVDGHHHDKELPEGYLQLKETVGFALSNSLLIEIERGIAAYEAFEALPVIDQPDIEKIPNWLAYHSAIQNLAVLKHEGYDDTLAAQTIATAESFFQQQVEQNKWMISERQKQDKAYQDYLNLSERYKKYIDLQKQHKNFLATTEYVADRLTVVQDNHILRSRFELEYASYLGQQAAQKDALANLEALEKEKETLEKVKKSLTELKPKVKVHLLPSLNKVASSLLAQMTNSERNSIEIDEEFDIKVDGQAMVELSGSAKAVANLAVRIGLGMVLTNRVFSVLLADEIDAAMDDVRAAYTAACIRNLYPTIGQIVLISHKQPEADNYIEL